MKQDKYNNNCMNCHFEPEGFPAVHTLIEGRCQWRPLKKLPRMGDKEKMKNNKEIKMLAEQQRDMDTGKQKYVVIGGQRLAVAPEAMEEFGLVNGQTITDDIRIAILGFTADLLEAEIAVKNAMEGS